MAEQLKNEAPKVLVTRGADGRLKALAEEQDGRLKTIEPTRANADRFLKLDTHGNALENFFKKFSAQFDNPSHTGLFAVSVEAIDKMTAFMEKVIRIDPEDKSLDPYRLQPQGGAQEQQKYGPFDLNKLDWKEADRLGISGEALQDALKAMVYGHKSPGLVDIKPVIDGQEYPMQARLSLEEQSDGSLKLVTHPRQEQPDLDKPFMGVMLTESDKEQLLKTGHGGRVFDLENPTGGEKVPSLVSLDKLTNRLEAIPLSAISIPATLKNVTLSPEQQQGLREGKAVWIEGMDKRVKPGETPQKIDRFVQFDAANRNFQFSSARQQARKLGEQPVQQPKERKGQFAGKVWVPKVLFGVKLSEQQFNSLLAGKATWVEGMTQPKSRQQAGETQAEATDAKGQKFNAWVRPEQEAGKLKYYRWNPEKAQKQGAEVKPAEGYQTQTAVNNEGKTNEATKQAQRNGEPLKKGQTQPDETQQRQQTPRTPKKSTGHKM